MDEGKKKMLMIVLAVFCIAFAGVVMKSRLFPSKPKASKVPVWLVCANKSCQAQYFIEPTEFHDMMRDSIQGGARMMPLARPTLLCQQCNKKSAFVGNKCVNQDCGNVYVPNYQRQNSGGFPDECPKCGNRAIQQ